MGLTGWRFVGAVWEIGEEEIEVLRMAATLGVAVVEGDELVEAGLRAGAVVEGGEGRDFGVGVGWGWDEVVGVRLLGGGGGTGVLD